MLIVGRIEVGRFFVRVMCKKWMLVSVRMVLVSLLINLSMMFLVISW